MYFKIIIKCLIIYILPSIHARVSKVNSEIADLLTSNQGWLYYFDGIKKHFIPASECANFWHKQPFIPKHLCANGVWKLSYGLCDEEFMVIVGEGNCFNITERIQAIQFIGKDPNDPWQNFWFVSNPTLDVVQELSDMRFSKPMPNKRYHIIGSINPDSKVIFSDDEDEAFTRAEEDPKSKRRSVFQFVFFEVEDNKDRFILRKNSTLQRIRNSKTKDELELINMNIKLARGDNFIHGINGKKSKIRTMSGQMIYDLISLDKTKWDKKVKKSQDRENREMRKEAGEKVEDPDEDSNPKYEMVEWDGMGFRDSPFDSDENEDQKKVTQGNWKKKGKGAENVNNIQIFINLDGESLRKMNDDRGVPAGPDPKSFAKFDPNPKVNEDKNTSNAKEKVSESSNSAKTSITFSDGDNAQTTSMQAQKGPSEKEKKETIVNKITITIKDNTFNNVNDSSNFITNDTIDAIVSKIQEEANEGHAKVEAIKEKSEVIEPRIADSVVIKKETVHKTSKIYPGENLDSATDGNVHDQYHGQMREGSTIQTKKVEKIMDEPTQAPKKRKKIKVLDEELSRRKRREIEDDEDDDDEVEGKDVLGEAEEDSDEEESEISEGDICETYRKLNASKCNDMRKLIVKSYLASARKISKARLANCDEFKQIGASSRIFSKACPQVPVPFLKVIFRMFRILMSDSFTQFPYDVRDNEDENGMIHNALVRCFSEAQPFKFVYANAKSKSHSKFLRLEYEKEKVSHQIPCHLRVNAKRYDIIMELVWKTITFTQYYCSSHFQELVSYRLKFYANIEQLFNPDMLFRWFNPDTSADSTKLLLKMFAEFNLPEIISTLDRCVAGAQSISGYDNWIDRPTIPDCGMQNKRPPIEPEKCSFFKKEIKKKVKVEGEKMFCFRHPKDIIEQDPSSKKLLENCDCTKFKN